MDPNHAKKLETLRRLGAKICARCDTVGQETSSCTVCAQKTSAAQVQEELRFQERMTALNRKHTELQNRLSLEHANRPNNRAYRAQVLDHAEDIREAMGEWDMGNGLFGGSAID